MILATAGMELPPYELITTAAAAKCIGAWQQALVRGSKCIGAGSESQGVEGGPSPRAALPLRGYRLRGAHC